MLLLKCYLPKYPMPPADACVDRLLKEFGGVTTHPFGVGTWRDPSTQDVCQEPVRVLECYVPDNAAALVEAIMQQYKEEARQKEVLYSLTRTYVIKLQPKEKHMNGYFERDNTAYPIGYLRIGEGYKVTDMRNLHPLHLHPIPVADAKTIASKANLKLQAHELSLDPDAPEVQAEVAAL